MKFCFWYFYVIFSVLGRSRSIFFCLGLFSFLTNEVTPVLCINWKLKRSLGGESENSWRLKLWFLKLLTSFCNCGDLGKALICASSFLSLCQLVTRCPSFRNQATWTLAERTFGSGMLSSWSFCAFCICFVPSFSYPLSRKIRSFRPSRWRNFKSRNKINNKLKEWNQ